MASDAARELVSHRRREPGVCVVCGAPFIGLSQGIRRRIYCGESCKYKAWYQLHAQEIAQRRKTRRQLASQTP